MNGPHIIGSAGDHRLIDPSDLASLARHFLSAISSNRLSEAQSDLATIAKFTTHIPSRSLLKQLASNGHKLIEREGLFYVEQVPSDIFARDLEQAVSDCSKMTELPAPTILVNPTERHSGVFLAQCIFDGFSIISISANSPRYPDCLRSTIYHEVAHCFLKSNSLLLDEGFATLFTQEFCGDEPSSHPADHRIAADIPMRSLLRTTAAEGLLFEGAGLSPEANAVASALAAQLIRDLLSAHGIAKIKQLFSDVDMSASPDDAIRLVEAQLGKTIEEYQGIVQPTRSAPNVGLEKQAHRSIVDAWCRRNSSALDGTITRLRDAFKANPAPSLLDCLISAKIAEARIKVIEGSPSCSALSEIDHLLSTPELNQMAPVRSWTLRGNRELLQIGLAKSNIVKVALAAQKAAYAYERALSTNIEDADLLINAGSLEVNTPERYGGNREKGLTYIRRALGDEVYGPFALAVLKHFGEAAPPPAPLPDSAPRQMNMSSTPRSPVVEANNLRVSVKGFCLEVDNLRINKGDRVAVIGPNGSGKTMLLETLLGLRARSGGELKFFGQNVRSSLRKRSLRARVGAQLQNIQLGRSVLVNELVKLHLSMYGKSDPAVAEALGIGELRPRQYGLLSLGQKQRVQLYLALAHAPEFAFFDEPTQGLDEHHCNALRALLNTSSAGERGYLLISHLSADLLNVDHVVCVSKGKIVESGPLSDLMDRLVGNYRASITQPITPEAYAQLTAIPYLVSAPHQANGVITLYGRSNFDHAFRRFVQQHNLTSFSLGLTTANDLLVQITRTKS